MAGQPATLAVLSVAGQLLPGATVEFTGGAQVTTDATGRATFAAPAEPGVLVARIAGAKVTVTATVVAPADSIPDGVTLSDFPRIITLNDTFRVSGTGFRGEAEANRVLLRDQPALILAASPVALVVQPGPRTAPGAAQFVVEVGGRSPGPVPVTLVALELNADKPQLAPRERGQLTVRVVGSEQRLTVEMRNLTPEVITLSRGNLHRVITSGGPTNAATVRMTGKSEGDFSVSVRVIFPAAGTPDIDAARQQLMLALPMAPSDWRRRVERVIRRLEKQPPDYFRARDDLERLLADYPPGEFGRQLEAAWRVLIQH